MGESTAFNRFHDWDSKGRGGIEDSELNTIHQNTSIRHYAGNISAIHQITNFNGHTLALPKNQLRIRVIEFYRWDPSPHEVIRIEYDPNRSSHLALLRNTINETYSYVIAPYNLQPGTIRSSHANLLCIVPILISVAIIRSFRQSPNSEKKGNCMPLKLIPVGTTINCIGLKPDGPAILCRSAGVSAQLVRTGEKGYAQVKLKSAGRSRWLCVRPTVRGVAMNAVDHPHGGGRGKSKGNRYPVSLWGVLAGFS
ncbi:3378_t:CDS:2 [Rhizophagus irregularis]|nr:3378_t:CDS:2 [Rhizophagus irregularis]